MKLFCFDISRWPLWVALSTILATIVFGIPGVFADELPELGESARAEFSPQLERKIGESIMNEIRLREPSYIDDPRSTTISTISAVDLLKQALIPLVISLFLPLATPWSMRLRCSVALSG